MENEFEIMDIFNEKHLVKLSFGYYDNDRLALNLVEVNTLCPYTTVTINMPKVNISKDQIIVKNYNENKGIIGFLLKNKLVKEDYNYFYVGLGGQCCICNITDKLKEFVDEN